MKLRTTNFASRIRIDNTRAAMGAMYALTAFPVIDFGLRHFVPVLGSLWDKLVLVILLLAAIPRLFGGSRPHTVTWSKFATYFIIYGLALVFSNFGQPLLVIAGYRMDVYYIFFGLLIPFVISQRDVEKLLYMASVTAILIGIHGVYQYITKTPVPASWMDIGEHLRTRVFSVLISCNELGAYMALMLPIVLSLVVYESNRWRKWMFGIGSLACGMTLLFTFSRAAWFSLVLAFVIVVALFARRLLILLPLVTLVALAVPAIHRRIVDVLSPAYWAQSAHGGRVARWHQAFVFMQKNPLFGVGPGRYGGAMATLHHLSLYSDNYYAKTLGEVGLVGLTLFFAMHATLLRDLWVRLRMISGKKRIVFLGGLTGLLSVLIHSGFENVFEYAPMSLTYFLVMSLLLVWGQPELGLANESTTTATVTKLQSRDWAVLAFWALSVTFLNIFVVRPLILYLGVLGVLILMIAAALWLVSIPPTHRKAWVMLTMFDLLLSQGLSGGALVHWHIAFETILAVFGLFALAWMVTRVHLRLIIISGLFVIPASVIGSLHLPISMHGLYALSGIVSAVLLAAWIVGGFTLRYRLQKALVRA
ncbi:O-antigen ligase family protein [Alicyclobacillus curvatus]|nr:O-antigen ligase family protein [Alicyclobacillus curvatus]